MSINKKSSRKIIVNNIEFIWKIKKIKDPCPCCENNTFKIMVEKVNFKKPLLAKIYNPFPENLSITPNIVKHLINFALKKGWNPESNVLFSLDFYDFNNLFLKLKIN
ncbi:MAG: hypothetical protein U0457_06360 [Candidatus Sericytochromatia bacterium]